MWVSLKMRATQKLPVEHGKYDVPWGWSTPFLPQEFDLICVQEVMISHILLNCGLGQAQILSITYCELDYL